MYKDGQILAIWDQVFVGLIFRQKSPEKLYASKIILNKNSIKRISVANNFQSCFADCAIDTYIHIKFIISVITES